MQRIWKWIQTLCTPSFSEHSFIYELTYYSVNATAGQRGNPAQQKTGVPRAAGFCFYFFFYFFFSSCFSAWLCWAASWIVWTVTVLKSTGAAGSPTFSKPTPSLPV